MEIYEEIGLRKDQYEEIVGILSGIDHIEEAIVYGSRAKGNYRKFSDIDLTLKGDSVTNADLYRLDDLLYMTYLPYMFDLSIYRDLKNRELIDHIERVGKVIFKRQ